MPNRLAVIPTGVPTVSKHIGRKQRWTQETPSRYVCDLGQVVYEERAWYALLGYRTLAPQASASDVPAWQSHTDRLGPFKRPRNAMVALEREATLLKNRHAKDILFGHQLGAQDRHQDPG
jgi:hypothetical protein